MARRPLFSSKRERRLWAWTLAVVVAIYSTLGLVPTLAGLVSQGMIVVAFVLGMFLVAVAILTQGLKARPGGIEIGVALGIAAVYLLIGVRATIPERSHLIEYSIVSILTLEALSERASQGRRVPVPAVSAWLATCVLGVLDEFIQAVLPSRVFEWRDILFNFVAATMAVIGMKALRWARRLAHKLRRDE